MLSPDAMGKEKIKEFCAGPVDVLLREKIGKAKRIKPCADAEGRLLCS